MNVELQAVTKIVQMVSRCPHLEPFIDSNDKTPLTDGHIDVHSSESHSKVTFEGRVTVQVKGRKLTGNMKVPRTFAISKTDLKGYLRNQGVLYFIVFINPRTAKALPTYIVLNPFKIQQLIKEMGSRKQVGVKIKELPTDPSKIEGIVKLALQASNEKPDMRIDLGQLDNVSSFTLYTDGGLNFDAPVRLTRADYDFTLAIETAGGMALSVDQELIITPNEYIGEATELTVSSGDLVFNNPIRRRVDRETFELELSGGLKLRIPDKGSSVSGSVLLTLRATLSERVKDLSFYLACLDNQAFSVNGFEYRFEVDSSGGQEVLREHFAYLTTLLSLCVELAVDPSLVELDPLEGRRGRQLAALYGVMFRGEKLSTEHHQTGRILQPMGRWSLQLIVLRDTTQGKWLCRDLFDPKLGQQFVMTSKNETGEPQVSRVTPYEVLEREHLPFTLNLHLDNLVNAYNGIFEYPGAAYYANKTVLNLIRAADIVEARKSEFLDAALSLNSWLTSKQGDLPHHQINDWQIAVRKGLLTREQRFAIRSLRDQAIRHEVDDPLVVETACAILLGDEEEIAYALDRLDDARLVQIQEWPIWDLHSPGGRQGHG